MRLNTVRRYLRAFFTAARMTLRGEKLPAPTQHPLLLWTRQFAVLVDGVYQVAERGGLNKNARQTIKLRIDGRPMSVETLLATLKFNAVTEYPTLLRHGVSRDVMNTFHASNLNHRYGIERLKAADELQNADLQAALTRLDQHLENIPQS